MQTNKQRIHQKILQAFFKDLAELPKFGTAPDTANLFVLLEEAEAKAHGLGMTSWAASAHIIHSRGRCRAHVSLGGERFALVASETAWRLTCE